MAWTEEGLAAAISRRELRVRRARWALTHDRFLGGNLAGRLRALSAMRRSALKHMHSMGHAAGEQLRHVQDKAAAALAGLGSKSMGSDGSGEDPRAGARGAARQAAAQAAAATVAGVAAQGGAAAGQRAVVEQHVERWAGHGGLGEGAEPMFCLERAVRLFAWSQLAYRCECSTCSEGGPRLPAATAACVQQQACSPPWPHPAGAGSGGAATWAGAARSARCACLTCSISRPFVTPSPTRVPC